VPRKEFASCVEMEFTLIDVIVLCFCRLGFYESAV
jgi:hypothetical protein